MYHVSTPLFCFDGEKKKFQLNGMFWSDNLEKSDQDHFKLKML